jgi:hypothetical protein
MRLGLPEWEIRLIGRSNAVSCAEAIEVADDKVLAAVNRASLANAQRLVRKSSEPLLGCLSFLSTLAVNPCQLIFRVKRHL